MFSFDPVPGQHLESLGGNEIRHFPVHFGVNKDNNEWIFATSTIRQGSQPPRPRRNPAKSSPNTCSAPPLANDDDMLQIL